MQYSGSLDDFLDVFLEFVKFDVLPSDLIWGFFFTLPDATGAERVARVGYESSYFFPNTGSMPIFVALTVVQQIMLALLACVVRRGRVHAYVKRK